jgi:hypothetical protein
MPFFFSVAALLSSLLRSIALGAGMLAEIKIHVAFASQYDRMKIQRADSIVNTIFMEERR